MILSPNDSPLMDSVSDMKNKNFGAKRTFTTGVQQKDHDYTVSVGGSSNIEENPVDDSIKDIDAMTDPASRKREFSRRAETNDRSDHNKERFHEISSDNKPLEDKSDVIVPDNKYHGSKLKNHFGNGQYESEIH